MPAPGMATYGMPSQADMSSMNPAGIPMQRAATATQQQVFNLIFENSLLLLLIVIIIMMMMMMTTMIMMMMIIIIIKIRGGY